MYFPYLILRGEEVSALIATISQYPDDKIIPVLEPYNDEDDELYSYKNLVKLIRSMVENKKKFVLIINSETDLNYLKKKFDCIDSYCIHGYSNENYNHLNDKNDIAIIHRNQNHFVTDKENIKYNIFMPEVSRFETYINRYNNSKTVLIEDGFIKHEPNSDYPAVEDFNSELCFTYKDKKICGFGDFTILGYGYQPSGGGKADSITHVVHLTKKETAEVDKLVVRHFLTTPSEEPDNRQRSAETIRKAHTNKGEFLKTIGIQMLEDKYPSSTSLGMYKRIGISHHIDLIHSLI